MRPHSAQGVDSTAPVAPGELPLKGIRVVEFSHMVMGPTCGMILGDLGAEVVKVEPVEGDNTRFLPGAGSGFFRTFNRNKSSFAVDMNRPEGLAAVKALIGRCEVVLENFRPGRMAKFGLDYATLSQAHPGLIYVSLKGFLPGPYEHRTALDEAVQMMGGLAYMTGPIGRPLRAGASVIDILGGIFGALGVLAALRTRDATGRGQEIQSGLFESVVMLSAQHMQQFAITGTRPMPMPARLPIWAIYDVFNTRDEGQIFLGIVSDGQWKAFCKSFQQPAWATDPRLTTNTQRCAAREWLLPELQAIFLTMTKQEIAAEFERSGLPFAPIMRPEELFDDPHVRHEGMAALQTETGEVTQIPLLPFSMGGQRLQPRSGIAPIGSHTLQIMSSLGYSQQEIDRLVSDRIVAGVAAASPKESSK